MLNVDYKSGDKVWLHLPEIDSDMWVCGVVVRVNDKTIRCIEEDSDTEGNWKPKHVQPR